MVGSRTPEGKPAELYTEEWHNLADNWQPKHGRLNPAEDAFLHDERISPLVRYLFIVASYKRTEETIPRLSQEAQDEVLREVREFIEKTRGFSGRLWMCKLLLELLGQGEEFEQVYKYNWVTLSSLKKEKNQPRKLRKNLVAKSKKRRRGV